MELTFQKVDLTGAVLNGTKLVEANLSGSILKNTTIKKSDLTNSICKKCNFKGAILNSSDFTNANLEDSIFETGQMLGTNFENANLKGCIFRSINLGYDGKPRQATNFKGANLDNCKIDNLHIFDNKYLNNNEVVTIKNIEVDLEKYGSLSSTISKITFEDSKFKNLKFMSQRALSRHQIDSVIFSRCEFINYSGHSSNYILVLFNNTKIEKGDFRSCIFKNVFLQNSNFKDNNFTGSVFKDTLNIINSDMTRCIFTTVKGLQRQTFKDTNFTSSSFNGTNLSEAIFIECNLQGCQFIPVLPAGAIGDFQSIPSDLTNTVF